MPWISVKDAHQRLDQAVSLSTVYKLAHSGKISVKRVLGKIILDSESFDAYCVDQGFAMIHGGKPGKLAG